MSNKKTLAEKTFDKTYDKKKKLVMSTKTASVVKDQNGHEAVVTEKLPKGTNGLVGCTFKVGSREGLYNTFLDLYPDVAKQCWGYEPFNWDRERRSIMIRMTEDPLELGSRIMFEVSKNSQDNTWSIFRTLLIPYVPMDENGVGCIG